MQRNWWWNCFDWTCVRFFFSLTRVWTRHLCFSSPALDQCALATSGFYLWQFQVFNSGAEGLVVVLFWLDLWEIFFLATPGFDPGTSGSLGLHSTTVAQKILVSPLTILGMQTIGSLVLYHCATITSGVYVWWFQIFNSSAEELVVELFWLDLGEIFF